MNQKKKSKSKKCSYQICKHSIKFHRNGFLEIKGCDALVELSKPYSDSDRAKV
jgi:hypothetical protein